MKAQTAPLFRTWLGWVAVAAVGLGGGCTQKQGGNRGATGSAGMSLSAGAAPGTGTGTVTPASGAGANRLADGSLVTTGWTEYKPSGDTRTIYVSTSGNDANDGRSPEKAVATAARGYELLRDGSPDWLLFKRGNVWKTELPWAKSGRSPAERMVIGAYGDPSMPRPRFEFSSSWLATSGGFSEKKSMDNLAFVSLHALGVNHDPSRGAPSGKNAYCVNWLRGAKDVRFEDMRFEFCQVGFQTFDGFPIERLHFYRSLFLDSYSLTMPPPEDTPHAQALFLLGVGGAVVEESVFDNCGWNPELARGKPTMFNHCIYWQKGGPPDGVVKNNVILRGSSHGVQMRSSGRIEGNVIAGCAIGGFLGGEWNAPPKTERQGYAVGNVITETSDIAPRGVHALQRDQNGQPASLRGWGFELITGIQNVELTDNIVSHCRASTNTCWSLPAAHGPSRVERNIAWKARNTRQGFLPDSAGPFVDPERTLGSYHATLGGEATLEAFAREVRKQSKTNWRAAYTASAVIQYFRDGFRSPAAK